MSSKKSSEPQFPVIFGNDLDKPVFEWNKRDASNEKRVDSKKPSEDPSFLEFLFGTSRTPERYFVVGERIFTTPEGKKSPMLIEQKDRRGNLAEKNRPYRDGGVRGGGTYLLWIRVGNNRYEVECTRHYGVKLMSRAIRTPEGIIKYKPVTSALEALAVRERVCTRLGEIGPLPQHTTAWSGFPTFGNESCEKVRALVNQANKELVSRGYHYELSVKPSFGRPKVSCRVMPQIAKSARIPKKKTSKKSSPRRR